MRIVMRMCGRLADIADTRSEMTTAWVSREVLQLQNVVCFPLSKNSSKESRYAMKKLSFNKHLFNR